MSSTNIFKFREWMYNRIHEETGEIREEFKKGLTEFMQFATNQEISRESGKMSCPCIKCDNEKFINIENVWKHCYWRGFTPGYFVWFSHGEDFSSLQRTGENSQSRGEPEESGPSINVEESIQPTIEDNTVRMVNDAHREVAQNPNLLEEPNLEARRFFEMLDAAKQPIYDGCKEGHSPLSAATRMMNIKTDYNLSEDCVDAIADFVKEYMPDENFAPASYYAIQKLVSGLGLPFQIIDVCKKNCMIFWKEDASLEACKFCGAQRYKITTGRSKIPHQRMWYLPLADRLKRLYQSERTASAMRWHAEHQYSGDISHPSDAEAWKHFCTTYPAFSSESRNVYLGLCTDGFNPFGKTGRKYSLWPVIVTPYNLPPALCMKREFLFLSILVPGPNHPRRSLDVFLQPLIEELQHLWNHGVTAFDVSNSTNFNLRAVLMWTISDFPAYGMLSGWTTHGRLACPYCQDNTDAFQLKHGRKSSWFDCHRRFLPYNHPYRRNRTLFMKNRVVTYGPPPVPSGAYILEQLRDFDVDSTIECGGNDHSVVGGYGEFHNWHKKSIFWELPYWKNHLLRHNLDVMHIEKNVFDNIIHTILNVQGKTKDNIKSRMDLPDICARPSLHLIENTKGPIPIFRLSVQAKNELFRWITEDVRFPDGYASNLSRCVDEQNGKFSGMKSHDAHVFMQRLLPFALSELLPKEVHESIAGISAFFRDLCSRSISTDSIRMLETNIPVLICNLEKNFPPSFFDVMEHLPIHLPLEARLGGPVQYRWMYPFERYMFHLKKKVKNLSRVEGSIVAQCINEETSYFSSFYFGAEVQTKSRKPSRYYDGGERNTYHINVPGMFSEVGRLSGKGRAIWFNDVEYKHIHTYILRNCEEVHPYESMFEDQVRSASPTMSESELETMKETHLANWLQYYVKTSTTPNEFPTWFEELVGGPLTQAMSFPMYFTRGYLFQKRRVASIRTTVNYGVLVKADPVEYFGEIVDILQIEYPGLINLKCVAFKCEL